VRKNGWLLALAIVCSAASARAADGITTTAREAYDLGTQAYQRGDYGTAAREYARADAIAPSAVALQAALESAVLADDPILGAELLDRARRGEPTPALRAAIDDAKKKFKGRVAHVRVSCDRCAARLDGVAITPGTARWVRVGSHVIVFEQNGAREDRAFEALPDQEIELVPTPSGKEPPPPPKPPVSEDKGGLAPGFFYVSLGLTAVAGGGLIFSALDTNKIHGKFELNGCSRVHSAICDDLADEGKSAQSRTNILIGVTAALGVTTMALGLLVRWRTTKVGFLSFQHVF
jgi:hypothetical protein